MMSRWTHPICDRCWSLVSDGRPPHRLLKPEAETCCWCREATQSGIYRRADPVNLACGGDHKGPA